MAFIPANSEPPCDFSAFVAERRGIARAQAEALIARWLEDYEPRARRAAIARSTLATLHANTPPNELRSCA